MSNSHWFVGIGSPHGDDRVGWEIATRVSRLAANAPVVRRAAKPSELLDWIAEVDILDICDAVAGLAPGSIHCWNWPAAEIERVAFSGTHDLSLVAVLSLAQQLGSLPREVRIWGLGIGRPTEGDALSAAVASAVPEICERICGALTHA